MQDLRTFESSVEKFVAWLDNNGASGYDPYDLWSTRYGCFARRLFYKFGKAAAPVVAPIVIADSLFPTAARLGRKKRTYATSHAHLILSFLDLHEIGFRGVDWIARAARLAKELDLMGTETRSGFGWGYPFDWQNRRGLWPKGTPLITVTPYCFEAYLRLHDATGEEHYLAMARSAAQFALDGLNNSERRGGAVASSYSPLDRSLVINASAYRAFVLATAASRFPMSQAAELSDRLVMFVLESQRSDGSWPYALEEKGDDFVDHFHTCFVLKNLYKVFLINESVAIWDAVEKGYSYYENKLFDADDLPKSFAAGKFGLLRYGLYDFAEAIALGCLLRGRIPQSFEMATRVANIAVERFQLPDGHFATSVDRFGLTNQFAFIRWPQAQLFHSMTSFLRASV